MKAIKLLLTVALFSAMMVVSGCSSSPSADEKAKLDNLKAEVTQLESNLRTKQNEKANLDKQVAEKNGRLKQCQSDQDAVRKASGNGGK